MTQLEEIFGTPGFLLIRIPTTFSWMPMLIGSPLHGILFWAITAVPAVLASRRKGRNYIFWGLFAGLFWGLGFLILAFLPSLTKDSRQEEEN